MRSYQSVGHTAMAVLVDRRNIFTKESARALNQALKKACKDEYKFFLSQKDRNAYCRKNLFSSKEQKFDILFALTQLRIRHHLGKRDYDFPVFYLTRNMDGLYCGKGSFPCLRLTGEFVKLYSDPIALEKVLQILSEKGISTWVDENGFFLGFREYSNLVFTARGYKVKKPSLFQDVL